MDSLRRMAWSAGRAGVVVAVVVTALTACEGSGSAELPVDPGSSPPGASGQPTPDVSSPPMATQARAAMAGVPLRYLYARGAEAEGVLVTAAGTTDTGLTAAAYVATRTGVVVAAGDRMYDVAEGRDPVGIGPAPEPSVFLQVDPALRYVVWEARRADGRHARVRIYDVVAQRLALDRVLPWRDPAGPLRVVVFGSERIRLVHLPRSDLWTFATRSGRTLVTPGGQVVDLRTRRVSGPTIGRGLRSPGLRYRAAAPRGRRPWQVVDLTTGRDVTPAALRGPDRRTTRLAGWLGTATFGALANSGTWRHTAVTGSVCHVAGRCRVVWRVRLGADDRGLSSSTEIG